MAAPAASDPHELLYARARELLDKALAEGTAAQADARIAKLRAWGMHVRADNVLAARIRVFGPLPTEPVFRWYRCHHCGWEYEYIAMRPECGNVRCHRTPYGLHVHSSVDGERPTTLPKHATSCSNQNAVHPFGAWIGARDCGCNSQ